MGYLMPKISFLKEQLLYWKDKEVHTFPKSICSKVNVITRLELELAYYEKEKNVIYNMW